MSDMNATTYDTSGGPTFGPLAHIRGLIDDLRERRAKQLDQNDEKEPVATLAWFEKRLVKATCASENSDNELTAPEAADLADVSPATIRRWCREGCRRRGILHHTRRGVSYKIDRSDLLEYIDGHLRLEAEQKEAA